MIKGKEMLQQADPDDAHDKIKVISRPSLQEYPDQYAIDTFINELKK